MKYTINIIRSAAHSTAQHSTAQLKPRLYHNNRFSASAFLTQFLFLPKNLTNTLNRFVTPLFTLKRFF
ncbi:MAG: hypothetical protein LBT84_07050, partial [Spirochaetia bacterium]|nr:hypothetical protein [Spirochaetia bacterium]